MTIGSLVTAISFPLVIISGIFWWVSSDSTSSRIAAGACFLAGVLGLIGYFLLSKDNVYKNFFDNHPEISGGKVNPQITYPIIQVGGTQLQYGGTGDPFNFGWANNSFRVWIQNGKLYVNSSVSDSTGKIVATLKNNELTVNGNNALDFNWDDTGIEVVDQYNRVVLQVQLSGNIVTLAGIFALANGGTVAIAPAALEQGGGMALEIAPPGQSIKTVLIPIFQYPGSTHLHERVSK